MRILETGLFIEISKLAICSKRDSRLTRSSERTSGLPGFAYATLDAEMNPKISDFGMARLFVVDQTQGNTSRIVGTRGYMAPEYMAHGQFSVKSDVFSFGVLVLEMITGKKNSSFRPSEYAQDLLSYAWRQWEEGSALELIDTTMRERYSGSEVMRCIEIGLLCVQEDVARRPAMASVVLMLNSHNITLPVPFPPGFFRGPNRELSIRAVEPCTHSTESSKSTARERSTSSTVIDQSVTVLQPR